MDSKLIRKYEKTTQLNDRGTKMRIISEEEMIAVVKAYEAKDKQDLEDGIANLHEEQALKIHMEETNAINDKRNQKKAVA